MPRQKRKLAASTRQKIKKLERQLQAVEAQIGRLETDASLGLAVQDHFVLWRRPNLFAPFTSDIQH
jgi:hypothetical protein